MPMDPLNEVSTERGVYMRETCARVLAAALMTGAIAAVVAMSALYDAPQEDGRALTAPPSSLQHSVRLALPASRRAPAAPRPRTAGPAQPRPVVVTHEVVRRVTVVRHVQPRRQLAAATPKAQPAPPPQTSPAPTPAPTAAPPAPAPAADGPGNGRGNGGDPPGQTDGHGNGQGNGNESANGNGNGNANGHEPHGH